MAFADTDGTTLKLVEETVYNTTPVNSLVWKSVRAKGWSLNPQIATVESEELSANVDVLDVITATQQGNFTLMAEYSKDALFETMLEHLFRGAFATNVLKGGVLRKSMTFEEVSQGTATEYAAMAGVRLDTMTISGAVGRIIDVNISGTGGQVAFSAASLVGTGTNAVVGTNRAMTLADLTAFTMTGDVTALTVLDFTMQIANNTRTQFGAGSKNLQGVGYGTRRVTGSFTAYFETREQLLKFTAGTKSALSFVLTDGTNSHTWSLPSIKFTDAEKSLSGRSADLTQKFTFTATYLAGSATAVQVTRT